MTLESFAVIGGEGFLGQAIIQQLLTLYPTSQVASFGLTQRTFEPKSYRFYNTDLTSDTSILESIKSSGCTTIFHTASPHPTASKTICEEVNIEGTKRVVEACRIAGVKKLIFTSSLTVCFEGEDLINVDERLPRTEKKDDDYVATKAVAEQIVLDANGIGGLLTCSIRLSGIIGPGDRQVIPGLIKVLKASQTNFQIGSNQNLFDIIHVRNAAHAHILAAEKLGLEAIDSDIFNTRLDLVNSTNVKRILPTSIWPQVSDRPIGLIDESLPAARNRFDQFNYLSLEPSPSTSSLTPPKILSSQSSTSVAGQAFFITNGEPIPFWSFARSVWYHYDGSVPGFIIPIPTSFANVLATLAEFYAEMRGKKKEEAGITKVHVKYVVSHLYCNIEKARRVLGYEPVISLEDGIRDAVESFKAEEKRLEKAHA